MKLSILLISGVFILSISYPTYAFEPYIDIETNKTTRVIKANGIPNHQPGIFPNPNNPNTIKPQHYNLTIMTHPQKNKIFTPNHHIPFGIAINGVLLDPKTAEYWNHDRHSGWNYNAFAPSIDLGLDSHNAHVQPNGAYHYHGTPYGLTPTLSTDETAILIGYAADGFPIYNQFGYKDPQDASSPIIKLQSSYQLKEGTRSTEPYGDHNGDFVEDYYFDASIGELDECNGRFGVTPDYPEGTYYYVITDTFPHIPRCFYGDPDPSFKSLKRHGRPSRHRSHGSPDGPLKPHPFHTD